MAERTPKIAYVTAGAAGMYCGSCMHDNTLARALTKQGVDVQLIPTYTPIRTDEEDVSIDQVFFGGINVFLEQQIPGYRFLPGFVRSLLDRPSLIRWATKGAASTSAKSLGALTVSMLRGDHGYQAAEVTKICDWISKTVHPDLVNFSNIMIAGCVPHLKRELDVPVVVTLQGDDIFLDSLPEPFKSQSFVEISKLVDHVEAFLTHSRYYAAFMSEYLGIPADKFRVVPLGIDTSGFPRADHSGETRSTSAGTIGYLARLAPEKGLHVLVDAFIELKKREGMQGARLEIAGWLGENNRRYAEQEFEKLCAAGVQEHFRYVGSIGREEKVNFLRGVDVLSVPTTYREPKGLFVLEALAAGIPVVVPSHGAFPELLEATGGGRLVPPNDPIALANELESLLLDSETCRSLGQVGATAVHEHHNAEIMAKNTLEVLSKFFADAIASPKGH
ncbi:MAG: glycosyltransferase family 4 protein [Planctomycetaceae bacterium]|nr:glycosyltransferase family 4 protein [Planctomycetales bacterium]MCB9922792.1 glycosyltransferase family 4 protein [Planctomycetaceae bacterium]